MNQHKNDKKKNTKKFHQYCEWSFGSLNIRTGKENDDGAKIYSVAKEMSKTGLQFLLLQEVRWKGVDSKLIELDIGEKYEFHWSGYKRKREAGVGILIRIDNFTEIEAPDFNTPRIMGINLKIHGFNLRVVNVYSPTDCDGTDEQKNKFYFDLKKASKKQQKHQKLIIAGDFNATTDVAKFKSNFSGTTNVIIDRNCNDNGQRLKQLCQSEKLSISSTFFKHRLFHRYTWHSNDHKTRKILDYILTQQYVQQFMTNCPVYNGFDVETDHRIIKATMYAPSTKNARKRYCKNPTPPKKRLDLKKLLDPTIRARFSTRINEQIRNTKNENADVSSRSQNLINVISDSANEILPEKPKTMDTSTKFYDDERLNELLNTRSKESKTSNTYKLLTKKIKKHARYLRNGRLRREAEQINSHATRRQTEELFRLMKNNDSSFKSLKNTGKCEPQKLKEHFCKHFNVAPPTDIPRELIEVPQFIRDLKTSDHFYLDQSPLTIEEIKKTLISLKNGKASTDIPPEFLKYSVISEEMLDEIHKIFCAVWETKIIPTNWTHSKLVCLWKGASKGSPTDPKTYRGLQIGTIMCKIIVITILNRLKGWYDQTLLDQQQGFRSGRGTSDGIFVTKRIQQITDMMKKPAFVLFVDLNSAFDHVVRSWLFKSIQQRFPPNVDNTLFQILEAVYSHTTTALSETPEDIFNLTTGVRQGGPESPPLYNLFKDNVMRVFQQECAQENIKFVKLRYRIRPTACTREQRRSGYQGDHYVNWSGYADDIELFLENVHDLKKALNILHYLFNK